MAVRPLNRIVEQLCSILLKEEYAGPDADLLKRFAHRHDEAAFEALVQRHGPMVMGVCLRVLRDPDDAEDAFQATFLVLVRKASFIRPASMVGNWLYGVAFRTALKARTAAARRRAKEAKAMPRAQSSKDIWDDLLPILTQELERLPKKYRAVLVHCDLEGRTRRQVALQLGWPEGTVASRLTTARAILAKRLARHGFGVSAGALGAMLGQNASGSVSPSVVSATVKTAMLFAAGRTALISVNVVSLAEGVLKAMLLTKVKVGALAFAVLGLVVAGGGLLATTTLGAGQAVAPQGAQSEDQEKQTNRKDEAKDEGAAAKLRQAETAFRSAQAKLREAQAAVPEARAMLRLQELRNVLKEQKVDLLLLALELERQQGRLKLLKDRLEYVLMRVQGKEEEKKSLVAVVRKELDPLIKKIVDAAERIETMRQSNDEMLGHLAEGEEGTNLRRLQQLKKDVQGQKDYSDWPERELARVRESLRGFVKAGLERVFKDAQLNDEDKTFLADTLKKEIDPILARADEIDRILGRVNGAMLKCLQGESEGTKEEE